MNRQTPHGIAIDMRLQGTQLIAEITPADPRFFAANHTLPDRGSRQSVQDTIDEIRRTVDLLLLDRYPPLRVGGLRFYQPGHLLFTTCGCSVSIPWREAFSVQDSLLRTGYPVRKEESVVYLERLLQEPDRSKQRYHAVINHAEEDLRILDTATSRIYDPRALFDTTSRQYTQGAGLAMRTTARQIVDDLGGWERAIAVLFLRLRRVDSRSTVQQATYRLLRGTDAELLLWR